MVRSTRGIRIWGYHIHRASESAFRSGLKPEKWAETTTAYASYEEAEQHFLKLINLSAAGKKHFPDRTAQTALPFEGRGEK